MEVVFIQNSFVQCIGNFFFFLTFRQFCFFKRKQQGKTEPVTVIGVTGKSQHWGRCKGDIARRYRTCTSEKALRAKAGVSLGSVKWVHKVFA